MNFAGPIADGAFEVSARPTRTNRSTQHWNIELAQDGVVTTTATAVFGNRRDTCGRPPRSRRPRPRPPMTWPLQVSPTSSRWRAITRCGSSPASSPLPKRADSRIRRPRCGVRDAPPRALDFPALTSLCDVFYPRAFLRLGRYLPAGTVSLTVYFHADATLLAAQARRRRPRHRRAQRFGKGYFDQSGEIWGHDGALLATTHQLVYFKD
ncbi:thioesterase family protein [Rhodococcus hoagii]|nr:thioesterase family protein [Prescottella equi]